MTYWSMFLEDSRWTTAARVCLSMWYIGVSFLLVHGCVAPFIFSFEFVERADRIDACLIFLESSIHSGDALARESALAVLQERSIGCKGHLHAHVLTDPYSCMLLLKSPTNATPCNLRIPFNIHIQDCQSQLSCRALRDAAWFHSSKQLDLHTKIGSRDTQVLDFLRRFTGNNSILILSAGSFNAFERFGHVTFCSCMPNSSASNNPEVVGILISTGSLHCWKPRSMGGDHKRSQTPAQDQNLWAMHAEWLTFQDAMYLAHFLKVLKSLTVPRSLFDFVTMEQAAVYAHTWRTASSWGKAILLRRWTESLFFTNSPVAPHMKATENSTHKAHAHYGGNKQSFVGQNKCTWEGQSLPLHRRESFLRHSLQESPGKQMAEIPQHRWEYTARHLNGLKGENFQLPRAKCSSHIRIKPCLTFDPRVHLKATPGKYTIILSYFWQVERSLLIAPMVEHYARARSVEKIFVVWHNLNVPCPESSMIGDVPVLFVPQECDSLNNRYLVDSRVTTECIFMVDDDIQVHHEDLERLFLVWQRFPLKLVGYFPRWFRPDKKYSGEYLPTSGRSYYQAKGYSFMLTKSLMFHRLYLHEYVCGKGRNLHEIVDETFNAEDLGLNLMAYSMLKQLPALAVMPRWPILDYGVQKTGGALYARGLQHFDDRSRNLGLFMEMYSIRSSWLCCQHVVAEVNLANASDPLTMQSMDKLRKFAYYPCMHVTQPGSCNFVTYSDIGKILKT